MVSMRGGPGTADPTRLEYANVPLITLIRNAWDLFPFQLSAPAWLSTTACDIKATLPPGTSEDEFRGMMRNLLEERFHLTLHRDTRQVAGYEVQLERSTPMLKPAASDSMPSVSVSMKVLPGATAPSIHLTARAQPLSRLIRMIGEESGRPAEDKTGLTGIYDYELEFAAGGRGPDPDQSGDAGPDIIPAVEKQLGLKVISKKVSLDYVIVDSIDRSPAEN
jgi:uncharacterized protein (TIGR03435 family)